MTRKEIIFKNNEIICLIGAGCSYDADIPTSNGMISKLEFLIKKDPEWRSYDKLYDFLKSSVHFSDGIEGIYSKELDIERLVNLLVELEKNQSSILYPFIGSWNPTLISLANYDFTIISNFKNKILDKLRE